LKTVAFEKKARNVFFHILTQCNLSCRHCYINPEQHGYNMLSVEIINKWLDELYTENTNVIFLGGEPTLHPHLSLSVKHAKSLGYTSVTIDTNGYLFHDILDKVNPNDVNFFSFSLDGSTPEINDPIRGHGSYENCIKGVKKAKNKKFCTSMIYTVSRLNLNDLKNMPQLLMDLNIDRFFIQVIGIRGKSAKDSKKLQLNKQEWTSVIPEIARKIAKLGITVTYPKVFLEANEQFECGAKVSENFFIFPNGRVYQCPLCEDFPLHSLNFVNNKLIPTKKINESQLFDLGIQEGCVMNKLIQPDNIIYNDQGNPEYKIACCLLKETVS